jgi:hypothetical protein
LFTFAVNSPDKVTEFPETTADGGIIYRKKAAYSELFPPTRQNVI